MLEAAAAAAKVASRVIQLIIREELYEASEIYMSNMSHSGHDDSSEMPPPWGRARAIRLYWRCAKQSSVATPMQCGRWFAA